MPIKKKGPFSLTGPAVEAKEGASPESVLILCHGYGSNGDDLISLVPHLQQVLPRTLFIAPNAPDICPGAPNGYQWFPLTDLSTEERIKGAYAAAPVLNNFLDEVLAEYGITEDHLALLGFSQGTMMSLHVGLRRQKELAGIVGFSGMLAAPERLVAEIKSRPPILLTHGDRDEVIPFPAMFEAVGALEAAGISVAKHLSHGLAHGIGPDGFQKAAAFLAQVLEG